jgi:phage shock protein E
MKRLIIDVREPAEFATGHVDGAINIPPSTLMQGASELGSVDKDTQLILYCRSGSRSQVSKHLLEQQGFTDVVNSINQANVEKNLL